MFTWPAGCHNHPRPEPPGPPDLWGNAGNRRGAAARPGQPAQHADRSVTITATARAARTRVETLTVSVWTDSSGRPVKFTVAGQSSSLIFSVTETFGNFNAPLAIFAP
jgi:hypothetical protein